MVFRSFLFLIVWITVLNGANLEKVSIQFDWKYQFEYAGYIAAKEKGFYKEAGLDVELREYGEGTDVVQDVLNSKATYGIYNSSVVVENGRIQPIVLMATYLQHSPLVFVTQKGIKNPADLIGKTIMATNNELNHSSLSLLMTHFDVTTSKSRFVDQTFNIAPFVRHEVDAMSAYRSNQLFELDRLKIPYDIIDPMEYGFVVNAGNLFTSRQEAVEHSLRGQKFIYATNRGWQYAIDHPDEIITILKRKYKVKKSNEALAYEAKVIKKLMMTDLYKIGETNSEFTQRLYKQVLHAGMIREDQKLGQFLFQDVVASAKNRFQLTQNEKNHLQEKKKITMCVDPEWYPLEAVQNGQHIGIASDIMKSFESKIGIPIELVKTGTWTESLIKAQNRQCDILSLASKTPDREHYLDFTATYLTLPYVLVTTMEKPFVENIDQLHGEKIGVVKGYEIENRLKKLYPELNIVEVESIRDGLKKVENGQLYGYIDNLVVATSYIQKEYAGSLKVSSRLNEKDELRVAVRNDDVVLYEVFEKLVAQIDEATMQKSYNRWVSTIEQVRWFDRALVVKILLALFLLAAAFIWRYTILKRYNTRLLELSTTDKLTGIYNRQKTDEKLGHEQQKVNRYRGYHCTIMMIDVDHFKNINDTFGHQEGDRILQKLAEVMKKSLRQSDMIGRWGGEEFMVILSHTSLDEAATVAEHLRHTVNEFPFTELYPVTISIGVGEFMYGEEVHECVARVDAALYRAKESGRNSVVLT
ncbi:diguanylate cyclase with extracellular sensor [Sulfuricurvum kujiense DSM 16994]|uniref:diguanylate cyclase n=1 Tax=Sulfuricurvum kujiense (strain ATCC BAA-921 / DSM 16994 / JCM 11577 / YK-1) TaxID=709032 RepID=E4U094_SULKY|nr:diguanylate cyclase [Sulfuricurvum kujiense]ADR34280.1 diguanylate cyclase with extracellular sensor [Sulfuricurvum kujiense DSM 16994]